MALDMDMFKKSKKTLYERIEEKKPAVMPNPFDKSASASAAPAAPTQQEGMRYFHSLKPNLGVSISDKLRVQFKGNYLETADSVVAEYLLAHYGKYVSEITAEQKTDANTIKE